VFSSKYLPALSAMLLEEQRNLRPTEATRIMPTNTTESATFDALTLPPLLSLYHHAFWRAGSHAERENIIPQAFFKALRAVDSFQPGAPIGAAMSRISRARQALRQLLRAQFGEAL
jgi:RNA polymerase sigma-70 factor (ECF subfamily)